MKQLLELDGLGFLHLRLGDLQTPVWFEVEPRFAVEMLFGTPFIDRLIRELFPSERRVVPWHSLPVVKLAGCQPSAAATSSPLSPALSADTKRKAVNHDF